MRDFIVFILICIGVYVGIQYCQIIPTPKPDVVVVPTPAPIVPKPEPIDNTPPTSVDDAFTKAKKQNKKVLLIFHADWCGYCQKLKGTLESAEVKEALTSFVVWRVDTDADKQTTKKYRITGLPSYIILSADANEVKRGSGYKSSNEFISWLK